MKFPCDFPVASRDFCDTIGLTVPQRENAVKRGESHAATVALYTLYRPGLKPAGWLKKQLEIQAAGLSGHLDQVWPDIRDSRWIGGDKDGWERVPYWLDGFIPLAWLLEDKDLQARAKRYIDAILAQQQKDGWICPCSLEERPNYDVWALFLLCKVLVVYEECSQDPRVEEAVYRACATSTPTSRSTPCSTGPPPGGSSASSPSTGCMSAAPRIGCWTWPMPCGWRALTTASAMKCRTAASP